MHFINERKTFRNSFVVFSFLLLTANTPVQSHPTEEPASSESATSPVVGDILNLSLMPTASVNADPYSRTFRWYLIPLTGQELSGVIRTLLPLKSPEQSDADLSLEMQIQKKLFRQNLVDAAEVRKLYELRVKENHFVGAEVCLHLLEKIASLKSNNSIELAKIKQELEDLKIPRTTARIAKADDCIQRGDLLTAYMELQLAKNFFAKMTGHELVKSIIDTKMSEIEKLKPKETESIRQQLSTEGPYIPVGIPLH